MEKYHNLQTTNTLHLIDKKKYNYVSITHPFGISCVILIKSKIHKSQTRNMVIRKCFVQYFCLFILWK